MSRPLHGGRHDWLGYLQPTGLVVAPAVLARLNLWPEPQGVAEGEAVARALERLAAGDPWPFFADVLGWPVDRVAGAPGGPARPSGLTVSLRDGETLLEADWGVEAPDGNAHQLLVRLEESGVLLDKRGTLGGWEATAQQRFERLLRETGVPAGVLLGARETGQDGALAPELRLVVAPPGEQSGWIAWPLDQLTGVAGRGMLAGLKLLLDDHALFKAGASHRLPAMLAESRAAQADVSVRLSGQVLAALHELLRGFDAAAPDLVRELAARDPHQLYEGLLTVLLRLIFILYAEDRELMPSTKAGGATELYEQGYALGGLHARLRDDEALNPDLMDERRGAWGRLLALFRLVERGHPSGFMQARGGKLFSEAAFPFLLGRRDASDAERVLPVGDGCILRVLDGLIMLGGERLAYRSLSVEQIGSVYETVMGFTAMRAPAPMLAIRAGKANKVPVWVDLAELARTPAADRAKLIKDRTGRGQLPAAVARALRSAGDVPALEAALASVVDARASPRGQAVGEGTPVLQPTDERRRTGSHYTPPSLTRPIVTHALEPAFARIGADATPEEVRDLKICDPAMGSGAFLVEACRQLGARLVEAWERHPAQQPTIPADEDALLHAKRLVAQHCLRGVDKNPLAVDLAKLSLWLETLAAEHEFTFLDDVLRHGDSLVGLPNPKIVAVTWGKLTGQHTILETVVRKGIKAAVELRRLRRAEAEIASYAVQANRYYDGRTELALAHLVADAVLESFFAGSNARERDRNLAEVQQLALAPSPASWEKLKVLADRLCASPLGITGFHWELEFDDVFDRPNPGFDAIVGNPPFAGKNTIASGHATSYPDWLKTLHPGSHGNADLSAHFFRRAYGLLRKGGAFGLIATNTIRQGDTRETGLKRIVEDGGVIYRAVSRHRWEGEAAVVVAQVFVRKGEVARDLSLAEEPKPMLDGRPVRRISAFLVDGELDGSPNLLKESGSTAFKGSVPLGLGFTFDDVNAAKGKANSLAEMYQLLAADERNQLVIKPYIGGEEVNNDPRHRHRRYIIDFFDRPLDRSCPDRSWTDLLDVERKQQIFQGRVAFDYPGEVAADWPHLLEIVRDRVKPERDVQTRPAIRDRWWQYCEKRPGLNRKEREASFVITITQTSPHLSVAQLPKGMVYDQKLVAIPVISNHLFPILQSRVHEVWTRVFAASLKDDLSYTPSDCFETFPLPPGYADAPALEAVGRAYHDHRARLMVARDQGMTPTYNRFHKAAETGEDIAELRRLHGEMDRAVLRAYGWDDLAERASPVFLTDEVEDDHQYQGRLFWPAAFRDELLARLLKLNGERAAAEKRL